MSLRLCAFCVADGRGIWITDTPATYQHGPKRDGYWMTYQNMLKAAEEGKLPGNTRYTHGQLLAVTQVAGTDVCPQHAKRALHVLGKVNLCDLESRE